MSALVYAVFLPLTQTPPTKTKKARAKVTLHPHWWAESVTSLCQSIFVTTQEGALLPIFQITARKFKNIA